MEPGIRPSPIIFLSHLRCFQAWQDSEKILLPSTQTVEIRKFSHFMIQIWFIRRDKRWRTPMPNPFTLWVEELLVLAYTAAWAWAIRVALEASLIANPKEISLLTKWTCHSCIILLTIWMACQISSLLMAPVSTLKWAVAAGTWCIITLMELASTYRLQKEVNQSIQLPLKKRMLDFTRVVPTPPL